ncbi:MAG: response regulator transcription factor [Gemmatimonadaceae bacterium]|nr:response regulator transcription factor [Gemmatimonadaceae bacterium]NUQ94810.1 response regulator transcription factor [Gemmatimonadaceae bacterium]NUR18389.1 response regulator transcription factor [Gemmatimonadaceae bacterium]NUS96729.1 response regulator transcription factor [Gemmatimonadaceae bacterium]
MTRVLVVEDNRNLALGLRNNLEVEGYVVDVAPDGEEALTSIRSTTPGLVILDLMLPGAFDGYRVLRTLREEGYGMPVIILTARGEELEKVRGFRLGADDYVTKPFGLMELLARVAAHLRRQRDARGANEGSKAESFAFGDVTVEAATRMVRRDGSPVALRPRELDLLIALLRRHGRIATRTELLREVWGYDPAVVSRTVDTHVAELRRKLESDPANPRHILTVRKTGYRIAT